MLALMDTLFSKHPEGLKGQWKESDSSRVSPWYGVCVAHLEAHLWPEHCLLCKQWKSEHIHCIIRNGSQVQSKIKSGLPKASEEVARGQVRRGASTSHIHCRDELGSAPAPCCPLQANRGAALRAPEALLPETAVPV